MSVVFCMFYIEWNENERVVILVVQLVFKYCLKMALCFCKRIRRTLCT